MADRRDPPPLFDDDDSRKDDNDDLFSSAVQSPVNGQVAPELTTATKHPSSPAMSNTAAQSVSDNSNVATTPVSPSDTSSLQPVHPLSDPLQADFSGLSDSTSINTNTPAVDSFSNTSDSGLGGVLNPANISLSNTLEITTSSIANTSDSCFVSSLPAFSDSAQESSSSDGAAVLTDIALDQPISLESDNSFLRSNFESNSSDGNGIGSIGPVMTSTSISNLPPVPSNMYNISNMAGVEDSPSSMDLFESCVEDAVVRPFATVSLSEHQEVSLDDDDDGLFSGGVLDNSQMKSQLDNASILSPATTLPTMGAPLTPPSALPTLPVTTSYGGSADAANANTIVTPPLPTAGAGVQPGGLYSPVQPPLASLTKLPTGNSNDDEFIEVLISEPQKVGDGMGSYMAYKMTTRTNITFFKKQCWSVTRRFSDFLGLHGKLVEKHLHTGRIIPPAPEKDAFNTTKLRLSSTDGFSDSARAAEFLERRRAALQRYMQRTAALPHLRADPDFREFVELDTELPRATQTSAMSGAGVMRLFNRVGETVNKITFKMEESDQWFEDRVHQMESLECELRRLHTALEGLATGRRELAVCSGSVGKAAALLSSVEEHSALSRALHQLAEAAERTHTVYHAQTDADFYILCETTRDYINLIGAVKEVFHERVKVFQAWQYSQTMLAKKRDLKAKLELTARQDKVVLAQQEVQEWEGKVERNQEHFERISLAIKKELEQFDVVRVQDFKNMLIRYLEAMVTSQQQVIKVWESFLPEAKAIS